VTAMPFSSHRAGLAPCCDFRTIRVREIAEAHAIGNVAADAGLLALVLERHLDGETDCPADVGLRGPRAGGRYLLRSDRLSPAAEDRPHYSVQTFGRRIRRRAGQLAVLAEPGQRDPADAVQRDKGPACAASRLPAPARRRGWALADQRRCTDAAEGLGRVRRRLRARCSQRYWRTIAVTICPGKSGHK